MDNLNFNNAKLYDKRTFWQYYISLIRTKHIIFFVFKPKYKFHSKIIRYCFLLFLFPLYLTINTFFVDKFTIQHIYNSKSSFDFSYNIQNIIYASFISYLVQIIFFNFFSVENDILVMKSIDTNNINKITNDIIQIVTIKCKLFFTICLILLNLCGFYISNFTVIFPKTKIHLIIRLIVSFSFSLVIPLILYFLPVSVRFYSLKRNSVYSECLYIISQYLQTL